MDLILARIETDWHSLGLRSWAAGYYRALRRSLAEKRVGPNQTSETSRLVFPNFRYCVR
jgi:hypothetical protein